MPKVNTKPTKPVGTRKTPECFGSDGNMDKCNMCILWEKCLEEWARVKIMRTPKGGQEWKP